MKTFLNIDNKKNGYEVKRFPFPTKRYCQTLELKDDPKLIEEYKKRHDKKFYWPEVGEGIRSVGILDMEIYLLGTRLFMIVEADIISKNGNLLLSVPMKGDGTIDDKEIKILEDIAAWMAVNEEGVFGTRIWKVFGEGPVAELSNPINAQGFNEGRHKPYTSEDIRFVTKGDALYAHILAGE